MYKILEMSEDFQPIVTGGEEARSEMNSEDEATQSSSKRRQFTSKGWIQMLLGGMMAALVVVWVRLFPEVIGLVALIRWYAQSRSSNVYRRSELDQYLEEGIFPRVERFDILNWWIINSAKFPILAKMARDMLAVPATTVASDAAFSVGGRVIDERRASLLPEMVSALVIGNDWIESRKKKNVEESSSAC